jgi:hypothetical protein
VSAIAKTIAGEVEAFIQRGGHPLPAIYVSPKAIRGSVGVAKGSLHIHPEDVVTCLAECSDAVDPTTYSNAHRALFIQSMFGCKVEYSPPPERAVEQRRFTLQA